MAWEELKRKGGVGGLATYGPKWDEVPAAALTKGGLTLNKPAEQLFKGYKSTKLLIDSERRMIGMKLCGQEEGDGAYDLKRSLSSTGGKKYPGLYRIGATSLIKRFPDALGFAYRIAFDASTKMMIIDLSPNNRLKK